MDESSLLDDEKDFDQFLKIIIIGDSGSGKTSILNRYINRKFDDNNKTTISPEFRPKIIKSNNIMFHFQFWDLPGQDKNPALTQIFCRDAKGIIFCCDYSRIETRENLKKWYNAVKTFNNVDIIPKIILENKCDLLKDKSHYNDNIESLREINNELGSINFFRTSALNGYNIDESIGYLIDECIKGVEENDIKYIDLESISQEIKLKNKSCCCCC